MADFFRRYLAPFIIIVIATGCQSSQPVAINNSTGKNSQDQSGYGVNYSLIYVIHSDANYLYHDNEGNDKQADVQKLEETKEIAKKALHGEVFIFHQLPEDKFLWIFPKKDRRMLHYKNGRLVQRKKYSPPNSKKRLDRESTLFKKYRSNSSSNFHNSRLFFLYYGHEIPGKRFYGYDASRPDTPISRKLFTEGAQSFLSEGEAFELSVLSTCDNGTPLMAESWSSFSRYLLASPQDLHLSYIDSTPLLRLEEQPDVSVSDLANTVAKESYDRLSGFLHTAVTLSVYNLKAVKSYIHQLAKSYRHSMDEGKINVMQKVNTDCSKLSFWKEDRYTKGVITYYQPPRFGSNSGQQTHSGWGCLAE